MKTLYLSDLDGTLLRSDERVSGYTADVINRFVRRGGCFSYATARSFVTASKVSAGLDIRFPVICGDGAFIIENAANDTLPLNFFTSDEVEIVYSILKKYGVYPIVSAYIDGTERFAYIEKCVTPAVRSYLDNRIGDPRRREVETADELYVGDIFRFSWMDTDAALSPIKNIFEADSRFSCIYLKAPYSDNRCCDILPVKSTKANAALRLKEMLGCEKMVVFGDERNDLSLFSAADEGYATANAVPELKEAATAVISSNDDDGVAKWIEENAEC